MQRYPPPSPTLEVTPDHHRRQSSSTSTAARAPTSPRIRSTGTRPQGPTLLSADGDDDDRWQLRPPGRKGSPALPFYSSGGAPPGGARPTGWGVRAWLSGRLRGGRVRWVVLLALAAGVLLWRSSGAGGDDLRSVAGDKAVPKATPVRVSAAPARVAGPVVAAAEPAEPPEAPPPPAKPAPPPSPAPPVDTSPIDVAVGPPISLAATTPDADSPFANRYLAYSPHSGYHNQRISLENALTLAYLLKRTLLLPPVWLGHAIPYISFDKLQRRLEMATKEGLEHCIAFGEGSSADPLPRECDGFWDWTVVDWSFLVDLSEAEQLVPIKRRWNMSMDWLADELALRAPNRRGERSDVFSLRDETMYQYRIYDSAEDDDPLDKWGHRLDLDQLRADSDQHTLVHVGSMFGTSRLRVTTDEGYDARGAFRRAMVFRTEEVDEVTEEIRDLLGGEGRYYGLHLRVGDGIFQKNARANMRGVWDKLCLDKMKLDAALCDEARALGERRPAQRRDVVEAVGTAAAGTALVKRANSRPQREGAYHHAPLPPLPKIRTLTDSPVSPTLTCRGALHTDARFLPFNAPLYIATDSKLAHQDPNLAVFFSAFPCTFVLGDFGALDSLGRLNRLRSAEDKTPLAQFLYPQLDAQIAAWGRGLVGTPQSTYSRFAIDVLHQVYHGWDIVERG
ncbi:hypothetical protein JCM10450v2_001021 [Rhodotorula kratochvilovae]